MKHWTKSEEILRPDPLFQSLLVSKFLNAFMVCGKKSTALSIFADAMDQVGKKVTDAAPLHVFETAIERVKPRVEVKSKRVGGATYQVPREVPKKRQQTLAFRWIIAAARSRKGQPMFRKLAEELVAAYRGEGAAVKKREDTHKMADANKAFAHFRW